MTFIEKIKTKLRIYRLLPIPLIYKIILLTSLYICSFMVVFNILTFRPDYNGMYIEQFSEDDEVCRLLLNDIHTFQENQNGLGGGSPDPELKIVLYRVKEGERLWDIHERTGLSMDTLLSMNPQKNVHILQPGQEIYIPNKDGLAYTIMDGETLESVSEEFDVDKAAIINVNDLNDSSIEEGADVFILNAKYTEKDRINILGRFVNPLKGKGRITSGFGMRKNPFNKKRSKHYGIDLAHYYGAPVYAAETGRVIFRGKRGGYGNLIVVNHAEGYSTWYGHLSKFRVKHGQKVSQGQVIGYIGSTGHVTGPHLHFEIRRYGRPRNPYSLMRVK